MELRACPVGIEIRFGATALELTTITVAVLGNLARHPIARHALIEKGLTGELAVLAQEHTAHLKDRNTAHSGDSTSSAVTPASGSEAEEIDPVLSERLLGTAVQALAEIARDDGSASNIARQGALRMLNVVATYATEVRTRT